LGLTDRERAERPRGPLERRGELGIGVGRPFFATTFVDSKRRDSQERPVAHYLVWLGKAAEAAPGVSCGPGLVSEMGPALDAVFGLGPSALGSGAERPLDALLRARFVGALPARDVAVVVGKSAALRWLGTISL